MFPEITNIYGKETKGPTLMEIMNIPHFILLSTSCIYCCLLGLKQPHIPLNFTPLLQARRCY